MNQDYDFMNLGYDINGNRRYAVHFLAVTNETDAEKAKELQKTVKPFQFHVSHLYDIAVNKANSIGGRKYNTKKMGGGLVFTGFSESELRKYITKLQNK